MSEAVLIREPKSIILFTRVDEAFKAEVRRVAVRDFDGNESQLVRDSVRLMIDLRNELGPRFALTIAGLMSDRTEGGSE